MITFPRDSQRRHVEKARRAVTATPAAQRAVYAEAMKVEREMQVYLMASLEKLQGSVPAGELARILSAADPAEVYRAFLGGTEALAVQLEMDVAGTVLAGGELAAAQLGGIGVLDMGAPKLQAWLREETAQLVTAVTTGQKEAIRAMVERGVLQGRHPARLAKDIQQIVGLDARQSSAVSRMREMMLADGKPADAVERAVDRYSKRLLKRRAQNIAHTESMSALNQGRFQLWGQLADEGVMPADQEHEWLTGEDERVCPVCEPLDRTTRKLGEPWQVKSGDVTMPPAHPRCRCTTALVLPRSRR